MAILDMERIMLYNVYNGWRGKLYNMTESHQTGKNGPGKRFPSLGYNFPMNAQKRHTAHLHKIW